MILHRNEIATAAGAEAPVVDRTHRRHMMENHAVTKVVLLHSALGDSRLWRRQVEVLRPGFEVVTPDLPGWGATPLPTESFSFVDFVAGDFREPEVLAVLETAWDWTEEMRTYFAAEEAAIEAGDLDAATEINLEFWVAPEHRDEVRPQQRRALELQTAHDEPEVLWPDASECQILSLAEECRPL